MDADKEKEHLDRIAELEKEVERLNHTSRRQSCGLV